MKGATDFRPILSKEKKAGESSSYENKKKSLMQKMSHLFISSIKFACPYIA
jgi:hypothetical protein